MMVPDAQSTNVLKSHVTNVAMTKYQKGRFCLDLEATQVLSKRSQ